LLIEPWDHFGFIRNLIKKQGTLIRNNAFFIASHTRNINAVLVTNNLRKFERDPELSLESWIAE